VTRVDVRDHRLDFLGPGQVGAFVIDVDARGGRHLRAQPFDVRRVSEAVEHDARAPGGERLRDTESDSAGRAGDQCELAFEHDGVPVQSSG